MRKFHRYILYCLIISIFQVLSFSHDNLRIGILTGYFHPFQREVREIYRKGYPYNFFASVKIKNNFYFSALYEQIKLKGRAIGEGEEEYFLNFGMRSILLSVYYKKDLGNLSTAFGIGVSNNSFKEKWENLPIKYSGKENGYTGYINLEVPLSERIWFLTSLRVDRIHTNESAFSKGLNLGGLKALFGVLVRLI